MKKPIRPEQRPVKERHGEAGSTMIETSLVLLLLMCMILFILDMGRFLLIQQYVAERARETARKAIVNAWTETDVKNYLCYNSTTAPGSGTPTTAGLLGVAPVHVSYSAPTAGVLSCCVQVKVRGISAQMFTPKLGGSYTLEPITVTLPKQSMGEAP